jgi:hypothetical protein
MSRPFTVAAVVHAGLTHPEGSPITRQRIDGSWPLRSKDRTAQIAYLAPIKALVAVAHRRVRGQRTLTVIDVRRVVDYTITGDRVDFSTVPAPDLEYLVGQPSPVTWRPGDGWPIKPLSLSTNGQTAA